MHPIDDSGKHVEADVRRVLRGESKISMEGERERKKELGGGVG